MKKRENKQQKIKQIIYHFGNSTDFIIYDLDSEGKHKNNFQRSKPYKYQRRNKNKAIEQKEELKEFSIKSSIQDHKNSVINEFPLMNFQLIYNSDSEFYSKTYIDHVESLCYPLINETEKKDLFDFNIHELCYASCYDEFNFNDEELQNFPLYF